MAVRERRGQASPKGVGEATVPLLHGCETGWEWFCETFWEWFWESCCGALAAMVASCKPAAIRPARTAAALL